MDEPRKLALFNEQYEIETKQLFLRQKAILDKFLERGAINRAQYDESLRVMRDGGELRNQRRPMCEQGQMLLLYLDEANHIPGLSTRPTACNPG